MSTAFNTFFFLNQKQDVDSLSEMANSVLEEGVYPLPKTASELSYGYIEDQDDAARLEDKEEEEQEDETETEEISLDDSLQDAASLNNKVWFQQLVIVHPLRKNESPSSVSQAAAFL